MFSVVEELSSPVFRKIAALVSPKRGYPELPTYPTIPALPIQYTFTHEQYTETIHRTSQQFGRVRAVPRFGELYPGICLTTEEKAG